MSRQKTVGTRIHDSLKGSLLKFPRVALNYGDVLRTLGMIAAILGLCMFLCLPWGSPAFGGGPEEKRGIAALLLSGGFSIMLGVILSLLGRGIVLAEIRAKRRIDALKAEAYAVSIEDNVAKLSKAAAEENDPYRLEIARARVGAAAEKAKEARKKAEAATIAAKSVTIDDVARRDASEEKRLFHKEAIVIVALSWIMAIALSALPYLFSGTERVPGVRMSFSDAIFESASGLTTTGATVFGELENTSTLPRTILFWRGFTHFLGGLGVMCLFVTLLGQGMSGKAMLKIEHSSSSAVPIAKIRQLAAVLFKNYVALTGVCFIALLICGMTVFDASFHAFSVMALGGFSTHNASVAFFSLNQETNGLAIEIVLIFFMVLAGTNHWLIYWVLARKPSMLFRDSEWRLYVSMLLIGVAITTLMGMRHRDFRMTSVPYDPTAQVLTTDGSEDPANLNRFPQETYNSILPQAGWGTALRRSAFQVVSLATGAGFATDRFELWNSQSLAVLVFLMFVGGCAGSTAGGIKVYRVMLAAKAWLHSFSESFSPDVVRVMRHDGANVDRDLLRTVVTYILTLSTLILITAVIVLTYEPDSIWLARGESQVEKMCDILVGSVSMYANVGPALGSLGSFDNYGALSEPTKFIFSWAMLLGRLEVWTVLTLLSRNFWRSR